jgi:diguanylate cyclase (GGDEF)-like protein
VALHDSLTGLPNRHLCEERLDAALGLASDARSDRPARPVTAAVCDVDQFKLINDTYGHAAGDHVLEVVAGRLRASVRADDTVGRLGGDEFVVIASDLEGPEAIESFAASLSAELSCPIQLPGSRLDVTVSIGLSSAPANEPGTRQALLREADEAMYAAKRRGRGLAVVFAGEVRERVLRRLAIRAELPRAVAERHFTLAYQPVVDIASEHPAGVEALLRWHSLELGQVPPDEFVPIAEESGVINALGDWVLDEACRQTAEWSRRQGWRDLSVAVNISAHQLATGSGLVGAVRRALLSSRLRPEQLVLELTETALMTDPEGALKVLLDLKRLGVGLAIDDFGTGYSSLVYLKQFPVDVLKVDRSFVAGIPEQADNHAIVTAVTGLARAVSLATVAEGVETREQLAAVRELQCTHGQGYLWSRPVPGAEVPSTLARLQESALQRSARERSAPQRPVPQPSTPRTSADVAR